MQRYLNKLIKHTCSIRYSYIHFSACSSLNLRVELCVEVDKMDVWSIFGVVRTVLSFYSMTSALVIVCSCKMLQLRDVHSELKYLNL
jgi:hypothetical protein